MTDNSEYTADDMLDWLCWMWAQDGERFFPPDETASECMEHFVECERVVEGSDEYLESLGWERGQHNRAWSEADMRFRDMEDWGFDPVERAAREHRELMERADSEVEPLDWSWWYRE